MISINSIMAETDVGYHKISVSLLLYQSLFLSTMLFNSQTWSKLRKKDMEELKTIQLKLLKRIIGVAKSTCNAFIFLELGVLPIEFEIRKRQLMFLHRIVNLEVSDPVFQMFENLVRMNNEGETNWWTDVEKLLEKYIGKGVWEVKEMSKGEYRSLVNSSIEKAALEELITECKSKKKTSSLTYESLKTQEYLKKLYPNQARVIFKCRSQTLDLKSHSTYKYNDLTCRRCCQEDETLEHIINCGNDEELILDYADGNLNFSNTVRCVKRIESFIEEVTA